MRSGVLLLAIVFLPAGARAQFGGTVPSFANPPQAEQEPEYTSLFSAVSFIDSALPRTTLRTRIDYETGDHRPTRADYLFSKRGLLLPEPRIDLTEWDTYFEFAATPWISLFLDQPYRWSNPEANPNRSGTGDTNFGFKFACYDTANILATLQLRATAPTASDAGLDNRHWSVEPSLLVNCKLIDSITIEGQLGYWMPISDYAYTGDTARYGIGLVYGSRSDASLWITPVFEATGWTTMGGLVEVVHPGGVEVRSANNTTIVNGSAGLRIGLGGGMELYGGYDRAVTGPSWFREQYRLEFRLVY